MFDLFQFGSITTVILKTEVTECDNVKKCNSIQKTSAKQAFRKAECH